MNGIDSNILEREADGKPLHTFPHPALGFQPRGTMRIMKKPGLRRAVSSAVRR
jgi:hypothetical protein